MRVSFILPLLFISSILSAQKINNQWIVGSSSTDPQKNKQVLIDFNGDEPLVSLHTTPHKFYCHGICSSLCDDDGKLLFFSNGLLVMSTDGEIMENGSGTCPNVLYWRPAYTAHNFLKGHFLLPDFTNKDIFYLFYVDPPTWDSFSTSLFYSIIDRSKNNGKGKVLAKNIPVLLGDSLHEYSLPTPIKHANGRDWWVINNGFDDNHYVRLLFTPDGIIDTFPTFTVDGPAEGQGLAKEIRGYKISKDGTKYLVGQQSDGIWVYDFNRCTGMLSNGKEILHFNSHHIIEDMTISENNRYLFCALDDEANLPTPNVTLRVDLWATIPSQAIDTISKFGSSLYPIGYFCDFPNGQIGFSGDTRYFHALPYPDSTELIIDTSFISWNFPVQLIWVNRSRIPNYYLGPLDNSPCDTLGLDNNPLAHWRYDRKPNPMEIKFVDLTYYEPTYWHWDFGDGQSSTEQHPVHIFAQAGIYEVCLIVGNTNSADTLCKMVTVGDLLSVEIVADTLSGCIPLTIHYHADTVAANSLHWTFDGGNPSQSNSADVLVTYDTVGMYMVNLMATGIISEKTDSRIVNVSDGPVADYDFTVDGLKMTAMNMSTDATAYAWDFGDGKKSAAINPAHLYAAPGSYNIQLVAINGCGRDTITRNLIITGTNDLASIFSFSLYPNPNDGVFEITIQGKQPADIKFRIFDVLGRTIWTKTWAKRQRLIEKIDLKRNGHFPQGTYFYQLQYEHRLVTGKLFIE